MIKVSLLLVAGLAAAGLLRRRSAALRHRVLAAAIACAALMPLIGVLVPGWEVPLLPASATAASQPAVLQDGGPPAPDGRPAASMKRVPGTVVWARALLPLAWGAGAIVAFALLATALLRLAWMASSARPVDDPRWTVAAAGIAGRMGLKAVPVLLLSDHRAVLFTWGTRRPKVLLPREAADWAEERIGIVLGHELAHVRRRDWIVQLLAHGVRCAYWFNPLVWVACRRLRLEGEHACDDEVLRHGVAAADYAGELLALASLFKGPPRPSFPAPAMARPSELERRVRVMLNARLDRAPVRRSSALLAWVGMLAVAVPLAGLSVTPGPASPSGSEPPVAATRQPTDAKTSTTATAVGRRVAAAQQTATLAGTISDQAGRTVPNLPVTLTDPTTSVTLEVASGQDGRFQLANLAPGVYQLRVSKPGFKTHVSDVELKARAVLRHDVVLELGRLSETITVSATAGRAVSPAAPRAAHPPVPPADDPCAGTTEGGCVTPPMKLADAKPVYPAQHANAGRSGVVVTQGVLKTDGSIGELQPQPDADPDFAAAAMHAIRLWKFSPARLNGEPVNVQVIVTINFQAAR